VSLAPPRLNQVVDLPALFLDHGVQLIVPAALQ
jgi:hypothetical protein